MLNDQVVLSSDAVCSAEDEISDREVDNQIVLAISYTISQLRLHLGTLDALVAVTERDGSIAECLWSLNLARM
jgi:hypothetical protein